MPIGGVVVRHAQVGSQCSFVPCDLVGQVWFEVGEVMRDDASLCVILFVGRFPARDQVTSSTDLSPLSARPIAVVMECQLVMLEG